MSKHHQNFCTINADIFIDTKDIIFNSPKPCSIVIPHVCNNIGLFGAGFASAVNNVFPEVKINFEMLGKKTKLGTVQYITVSENKNTKSRLIFANMIAQNQIISQKNPRPLNYEFLVKSMIDVRNYVQTLSDKTDTTVEIHAPKFGSGLAGGNWNFIENLIEDIWKNIPVFIYSYNPNKNKVLNNNV